jgi:chromosome segregation ATPase
MSNNAEILNAILDLKTHFDGKFDRVEQRLDRVEQCLDRLEQRADGVDQRLEDMNHRLKDLQITTHNQGERISRMEGRLDEQSRILAALIPTRVAAVPPAAE